MPLVYFGDRSLVFKKQAATLADVAPTLLHLMDLPPPPEMRGEILIHLK